MSPGNRLESLCRSLNLVSRRDLGDEYRPPLSTGALITLLQSTIVKAFRYSPKKNVRLLHQRRSTRWVASMSNIMRSLFHHRFSNEKRFGNMPIHSVQKSLKSLLLFGFPRSMREIALLSPRFIIWKMTGIISISPFRERNRVVYLGNEGSFKRSGMRNGSFVRMIRGLLIGLYMPSPNNCKLKLWILPNNNGSFEPFE